MTRPYALLLALGGLLAAPATAKFLVLHSNGAFDATGTRYWNTFAAPSAGGPDDVAFLAALLTAIG